MAAHGPTEDGAGDGAGEAPGDADLPPVEELLEAAVTALGGTAREGQQRMAAAVASAVADRRHLLVQAGTGTGKSLGYLVPVVRHAVATGRPVVVATATLALQAQVVDRDLPRLADALEPLLGRRPTWQLVKGRANYVCRHKLGGGFPDPGDLLLDLPAPATDPAAALVGEPADPDGAPARDAAAPSTAFGRDVRRLRRWAQSTRSGDRDELVPGVPERVWRQVAVTAAECLGAQRCPQAAGCFSERARARARGVDVVVTNHALLAVDVVERGALLPEADVVVVDEGHELADRVTAAVSDRLTATTVAAAATAARRALGKGRGDGAGDEDIDRLDAAGDDLGAVLEPLPEGRLARAVPEVLTAVLAAIRDAARSVLSRLRHDGAAAADDGGRQVARAAVGEVLDVAERLLARDQGDVVWLAHGDGSPGSARRTLHVAPLSVADDLRQKLLAERTVVLTSATLALGGTFDAVAASVGLSGPDAPPGDHVDVGSPFDHRRQGILYVARHLPPPGRDGTAAATLDELCALVEAAGGRTLGLFSSRRAAQAAAEVVRQRLDVPVLCQGEDALATLVRRFAADAPTCLFGTLSLWQGVDVPGPSCQLVVVDRIPFPRPDDPLGTARQEAVARSGGNGFLAVAATHAALRLAQGTGRLLRSGSDRGVVAVLDPRLVTARYGAFLTASLPALWRTTDRDQVLAALRRLDASAGRPWPVGDPVAR